MSSIQAKKIKLNDPSGKEEQFENIKRIHFIFEKADSKIIRFNGSQNSLNVNHLQLQIRFANDKIYIFGTDRQASQVNDSLVGLKPIYEDQISSFTIEQTDPKSRKEISLSSTDDDKQWLDVYDDTGSSQIKIEFLDSDNSPIENKEVYEKDVLLLYEIAKDGKIGILELNKRGDGYRFDFPGDFAPAMDLGGYFKVNKGDDEVSIKVYGGNHSKDDPKKARCYDIGITYSGDRIRLRTEHEHNGSGGGPYSDNLEVQSLKIGSIIGKWIGFRFIGIHSKEGEKKKTRLLTFIDTDGLKDGKPGNNWKKVADWLDDGTKYFEGTKKKYKNKPFENGPPYGKYPYDEGAQQTIRIDDDNPSIDYKEEYVWCRQIDPSKPLCQDIIDMKIENT